MLSGVISSRSHHSFRDQHKGVFMRKTPVFVSTSARGLLGFPTSKAQLCTFDIAPMWKMYMESIEAWKKNYGSFLNGTPFRANGIGENSGAGLATSFYDGALLQWRHNRPAAHRDPSSGSQRPSRI
jgi:hypothetical protein